MAAYNRGRRREGGREEGEEGGDLFGFDEVREEPDVG